MRPAMNSTKLFFAMSSTLFASAFPCENAMAQSQQVPVESLQLWYLQPAKTGEPSASAPAVFSGFGAASGNQTTQETGQPLYRLPEGRGGGFGSLYMNEALPIGNGRLGALVFGGTARERLVLNEISLWSGDENPSGAYETMGSYETLGNVWIDFPGHDTATSYRRWLDLSNAQTSVSYSVDGTTYRRDAIASAPDGVIAVRITADQPGRLTGAVRWQDAHEAPLRSEKDALFASGSLSNGLKFCTGLAVVPTGGSLRKVDGGWEFENCDSLLLLAAAATDYAMDAGRGYRSGRDPETEVAARLAQAASKGWESIRSAHETDYRRLFDRVALDLGDSTPEQRAMPTDARRKQAIKGDPELESLLFHYARYLLISCSRPGGLPANLQGLWNDVNNPPWHSDYHTNINVQMNYWLAEVGNLAELHTPLFDLILSQLDSWRRATAASPDFRPLTTDSTPGGWAVRTSHNTMGGGGWKWDKTANVWYAHHFWEHFAFGQDREWLRQTAWPVMRELAEFWLDRLKELPDGTLVVPNGWSPEHGPTEDGVAYSQQKIWNHFTNCLDALEILGGDEALRQQLLEARGKLLGPSTGSWGQLLEWSSERAVPKFQSNDRWMKNAPAWMEQMSRQATETPKSPRSTIWRRLVPSPTNPAELAAALNAAVDGPPLWDDPALIPARTDALSILQQRASGHPVLVRWINWSLLVRSLGLEALVATEDTPLNTHRHTSHLFGVYPGRQISKSLSPEFADAALVSLIGRGDSGNVTEWAFAWRTALYARLGDAQAAHRQIGRFFGTSCPNLFGNHPPMQIDGTFGTAAGIAEMLLQSHENGIHLLPALPSQWSSGSVRGLRARGGYEVDITWKDGRLTSAELTSLSGLPVTVSYAGQSVPLSPARGERVILSASAFSNRAKPAQP